MNPVLVEIYSTVAPSMPFIIGAYALMWSHSKFMSLYR